MRVFVTGATGFVGNAIAEKLLERGHSVKALVRKGSEKKLRVAERCELAFGDIGDTPDRLAQLIRSSDAVIHLVGIIEEKPSKGITFEKLHVEGTRNIAQASLQANVKRFIHMSALGARNAAPTKYFDTKWRAEEFLRTLKLDLTVFRPSVIIGPSGEFTALMKRLCSLPITPVIGDGEYTLQPVALKDVAQSFVSALEKPEITTGKAYCLGGPTPVTFNEMLKTFATAMGKKVRLMHLPKTPIKIMTSFLEGLPFYPITTEQLTMLEENQLCDIQPMRSELGVEPIPLMRACEIALK